jgi:integrase
VRDIRIHDLRHAGATILMTLGVPDPIVRKITGHRSRELERDQHLTPARRNQTCGWARRRVCRLPDEVFDLL